MRPLTAQTVIRQLNKFIEQDHEAVSNLVDLRVDCARIKTANADFTPHISAYQRPLMGLLEVLNHLVGPDNVIVPVRDPRNKLCSFKLRRSADITTPPKPSPKQVAQHCDEPISSDMLMDAGIL